MVDKLHGVYFNKYGDAMGNSFRDYHANVLTESDYKELQELQVKKKAWGIMKHYEFKDLTVDQAEKIIEILEKV
jgi:hypothetical protein